MKRRSHNLKRNRITYVRSSRQNQGPYSALSTLEQEIIAEQKAARATQQQMNAKRAELAVLAPEKQRVDGVIII